MELEDSSLEHWSCWFCKNIAGDRPQKIASAVNHEKNTAIQFIQKRFTLSRWKSTLWKKKIDPTPEHQGSHPRSFKIKLGLWGQFISFTAQ